MKTLRCLFFVGLFAVLQFGCASSRDIAPSPDPVMVDYKAVLEANPMPADKKIQVIPVGGNEDVSLFVARFAPGVEVKPHYHQTHSEMIYVIEGTGSMTLGDTDYQLKPGMIHFNPKTKVHSAKNTGDSYLIVLQAFTPKWDKPDRVPVP